MCSHRDSVQFVMSWHFLAIMHHEVGLSVPVVFLRDARISADRDIIHSQTCRL